MVEYIYILGYGRSGSTLIESHLQKHINCTGIGEAKYYPERGVLKNEKCGCGQSFSNCNFWQEIHSSNEIKDIDYKDLSELTDKYDSSMWFLLNIFKQNKELNRYIMGHYSILKEIQSKIGKKTIIDSSKMPARIFWLYPKLKEEMNVKVLWITRDPRAVSWSCGRKIKRTESSNTRLDIKTKSSDKYMPQFGYFESIFKWNLNTLISYIVIKTRLKNNVIHIKYEDFVENHERVIREVSYFLDKDTKDNNYITDEDFHSISGNPRRLSGKLNKIIPDKEWENQISSNKKFFGWLASFPGNFLTKYKI